MKRAVFANTWPVVASVCALAVGIAALNEDVHRFVRRLFAGGASAELSSASWYVQDVTREMTRAARDMSIEHAPLMIFAVAAGVLLLFMLRT